MTEVLALFFAAGFTYVVSLSAGKMLLDALRVKLYRSEECFLGFVLGSALLSTVVFLLTAVHLAYTSTFLILGLATLALAAWRGAYRFTNEVLPPLSKFWSRGFALVYLVFAFVYLRNALIPEFSADALVYHIALPARYLREHFFPPNDRDMLANLSEGIEMLFLFALSFARYSAGAMVHLVFTLVLPFGILSWGRRVGYPQVGAAAGLMVFVSPVVGKLATIGYIDVAVACVVFALFYMLEIWKDGQSSRTLVAVGLLAGFCYAAKYTSGIAVPYALVVVAYHKRKDFLRPVLLAGSFAAVMMAPYLVKNTLVTGNPVAPFFNQVFPNPVVTVSLEHIYTNQMRHWNNVNLSETPLELTVRGFRLQGVIGPVFLLAPLALLGLRFPPARPVLVAAVVFGLTYITNIGTRFLVPTLPFIALGIAWAVARWNLALAALVLSHAVLSWPRVVPLYCDNCWRLVHEEWKDALRFQPEESYLRTQLPEYAMSEAVEKQVPPREPIFSFGTYEQTYQSHEIIVGWESAFGHRLAVALETQVFDWLWPTRRQEVRFPEKGVRKLRLYQQASSEKEEWSISELRVFRGDSEIARAPEWRVRTQPNRWEAQLAIDNSPVTRWSSGEPMQPGMWLELDFGQELPMDRVVVEFTNDQFTSRARVESEGAPGVWTELMGDTLVSENKDAPRFRAAGTAYFSANHVRWMLINDNDSVAKDMDKQPDEWGIRRVAREADWTLYTVK